MTGKFSDWQSLLEWLDGRGMFHMQLGLERMHNALDRLRLTNPPYRICQVLGTNGKGSTCAFLASLLDKSGLKTGLYTSPHFISPKERCRINGVAADSEAWLEAAAELTARVMEWEDLTYFEFITLIALLIFRNAGCQAVILEAGLGGKNDATTAADADLVCFAPIAMDHAQVIGPTLSDIARDKAAAIRPHKPVLSERQFPEAREILIREAKRKDSPIEFCPPWPIPAGSRLNGAFQQDNMGLAVAAAMLLWQAFNIAKPEPQEIDESLKTAFLPGRRQLVRPFAKGASLILDGGHNPHAINAGVKANPEEPEAVIFSCLADKDWKPGLAMLAGKYPEAKFIVPQLYNSRAADAGEIAEWLNKEGARKALPIYGRDSVRTAIDTGCRNGSAGLVLMTGSFFLLAEFYALFPQYLEFDEAVGTEDL